MIGGLGGWVTALIIGLLLYLLAPVVDGTPGRVMRVVGVVVLVVAAVLLVLWLIGLLTGSAVISAAAVLV